MSDALARLKAIAAAKRNAENAPIQPAVSSNSSDPSTIPDSDTPVEVTSHDILPDDSNKSVADPDNASDSVGVSVDCESSGDSVPEAVEHTATDSSSSDNSGMAAVGSSSGLSGDHPIKMQLAELEAALKGNVPEFRTILRDIHSKLRQDPEIVTAMSEEEISLIVSGLVAHANVEVLAPKAAKKAKSLGTAKNPISAGDL